MILGIGIDIVETNRFTEWQKKSSAELLRIFSEQEITYCLSDNGAHAAARFAARFAAREAFFKAYQSMLSTFQIEGKHTLFGIQRQVIVTRSDKGVPSLNIAWKDLLPEQIAYPKTHISISHTDGMASALVVLETNV